MGSWLFDDQNMDLPDPVSNIPTRPTTFLILKLFLTLEEGDGALINEAAPYHSYKVGTHLINSVHAIRISTVTW